MSVLVLVESFLYGQGRTINIAYGSFGLSGNAIALAQRLSTARWLPQSNL